MIQYFAPSKGVKLVMYMVQKAPKRSQNIGTITIRRPTIRYRPSRCLNCITSARGIPMNGTKAADGAFSRLGMSSLKQAVLQQHHVFSKASSQSAWLCQHHHIHSYGSAYTLTEAWRLASLWETSSLQASLRKTYMRIVSQESKQLVSPLVY